MLKLELTPEEFRFLLDLIEVDAEDREEQYKKAVNAGFNPATNCVARSLRKKANNAYHDWEKDQL